MGEIKCSHEMMVMMDYSGEVEERDSKIEGDGRLEKEVGRDFCLLTLRQISLMTKG